MFFSFHPAMVHAAMVHVMSFDIKIHEISLIASTSSVLTSLRRTKFIITCIVVNILTIRVIMKIDNVFLVASTNDSNHDL